MLSEALVAAAARAAGIEAPVRFVEVTGSTNADLLALAATGAPAWSVVVAGHQEAGRGRLGRTWVEPAGSSLLVSVLVRPDLAPERSAMLTLAAGLAAVTAVSSAAGLEGVTCAWPNDVVIGKRKLAGILTEGAVEGARLAHAVVGMGLNLTQGRRDFPEELRETATSVALEGGRADDAALLRAFLAELRGAVEGLRDDPAAIVRRYVARCSTIGREVRAVTVEGDLVTGRASGVGDTGDLLVRTSEGTTRRVGFGEVRGVR